MKRQCLRGIQSFSKSLKGLSFVFIWAAPQISHAGAWNLPKNQGQVIVTGAFTNANGFLDDDGNRQDADFSKTETRVFFEHGLTDRWTVTVNSAFQMSQFQGGADGDFVGGSFNFDDFDDTEFGLRYQVKRSTGLAVSVQASYIIDGGPADNILDVGGGRDAVELRALWGQSYDSERWGGVFFDAQVAGRLRTNDGNYDSTRADLTLGYKPTEKWFVFLQNFSTLQTGEAETGGDILPEEAMRVNPQFQFKSSLSAGYAYKPNQIVQIGLSQTLFGRNIVKERGVFISTWLKY